MILGCNSFAVPEGLGCNLGSIGPSTPAKHGFRTFSRHCGPTSTCGVKSPLFGLAPGETGANAGDTSDTITLSVCGGFGHRGSKWGATRHEVGMQTLLFATSKRKVGE